MDAATVFGFCMGVVARTVTGAVLRRIGWVCVGIVGLFALDLMRGNGPRHP